MILSGFSPKYKEFSFKFKVLEKMFCQKRKKPFNDYNVSDHLLFLQTAPSGPKDASSADQKSTKRQSARNPTFADAVEKRVTCRR